jgi:hypothetical protein
VSIIQCKCGLSIIESCIKIAESKPIYLKIKESILEALGGKELPQNFRIVKFILFYLFGLRICFQVYEIFAIDLHLVLIK